KRPGRRPRTTPSPTNEPRPVLRRGARSFPPGKNPTEAPCRSPASSRIGPISCLAEPRSPLRSLPTPLLLSLGCVLPLPASADAPPTRQDLQTALKSLADRKLPEAEHKPLQQALEQAMTFLGEQSESLEKLEALQAQLVEAPAQTRQAQADLQTLRN